MKKLYIKMKKCSYYSDGNENMLCKIETIRNDIEYQIIPTSSESIQSVLITNKSPSIFEKDLKILIIGNGIIFIPLNCYNDLETILEPYLSNIDIPN